MEIGQAAEEFGDDGSGVGVATRLEGGEEDAGLEVLLGIGHGASCQLSDFSGQFCRV